MRGLLLLVLALAPGCVTQRYQESGEGIYRWRLASIDTPRTLVAGSVRVAADGSPYAVRLRVLTDRGEIVDYEEGAAGKLAISERGFAAPVKLHPTGNSSLVVVETDDPELVIGTSVRHTSKEGGELSAPSPLTEEEAREATVVLFKGGRVTVLAPPLVGRRVLDGRASLAADRGESYELEKPRRGKWVVYKPDLVRYYVFLPLVMVLDAATFPVSVTGLLLHDAGLDGEDPVVGRKREHRAPWEAPPPPPRPLPETDAQE
jgi:hypothetical protein